jgi:hypothetical protein
MGQRRLGQRRLGQRRLGQRRLGQRRLGQRRLGQKRLGQRRLGQRLGRRYRCWARSSNYQIHSFEEGLEGWRGAGQWRGVGQKIVPVKALKDGGHVFFGHLESSKSPNIRRG